MVERRDLMDPPTTPLVGDGDGVVSGLVHANLLLLFSYSCDRRFLLSWTPNIADVLGVREPDITREGNLFFRHTHPEDRFRLLPLLEESMERGTPYEATYRWVRPDNDKERWLHCRAHRRTRGTERSLDGCIIDITEASTIIEGPREGPDSWRTILDSLPLAMIAVDARFHVVSIGGAPLTYTFGDPLFKLSSLTTGATFLNAFTSPELRGVFAEYGNQILSGTRALHTYEVEHFTTIQRIEVLPRRFEGSIVGLLITVTDVSELAATRRKLIEAERGQGFVQLASSVAHLAQDNLNSILGEASLLSSQADDPTRVRELARHISNLAKEGGALMQQLLAVGSIAAAPSADFDLNLISMAAINRIGGLFFSDRRVAVGFGNNVRVKGNEQRVSSALESIIREMHRATPPHGLLSLKTSRCMLDDDAALHIQRGAYAKISLSNLDRSAPRIKQNSIPLRGVPELFARFEDAISLIEREGGILLVDDMNSPQCFLSILFPSSKPEESATPSAMGL